VRVWVTRDEGEQGPLSEALRAVSLAPVLEPVVRRCVIPGAGDVVSQLGANDWLVLTSGFAIASVAESAGRVPRVAVVGESSRRAAEARGFRVELVGRDHNASSVFEQLRRVASDCTVCYPRSSLASEPIGWPGVRLLSPVLYETRRCDFDSGVVRRVDVAAVASASAAVALGAVDLPYASIGPSTSAAIVKLGIHPWVEAPARSFDSLAGAIADQASSSFHQRA